MEVQVRKRPRKNGSIAYQAVIEVNQEGKRRVITVGTYDSEREAQREGDRASARYETDIEKAAALRSKTTLSAWAEEWLTSRKGKIKESSQREYTFKLRNYVLPYLGTKRLADLSPIHIRRWLDELPARGVSVTTQNHALTILKICLSGAVKDGALIHNPAKGVKVERSKALQEELCGQSAHKVWSHEEAQKLLKASETNPTTLADSSDHPKLGSRDLDAFIVLGLLAGLRPGEIGGLKWEDIDLLEGTVTVRRANRKATSTKSGKVRTVPLPWEAVRRLSNVQASSPGSWVLSLTVKQVSRQLRAFLVNQGVTVLPPHSMRHTFASLLLSAGVPVPAVSKLLGHSSPIITLQVYSHAMPKDLDRATSVLERALNVSPPVIPTHSETEDLIRG